MFTALYAWGSPKLFYKRSSKYIIPLGVLAAVLLMIGFTWGLFFSPVDYQQGDAVRIMYIHVPAATLSLSLYALLGFLALLRLIWRIKLAGMLISIVAEVGVYMTFLALCTGSIWGKPMWGAWWVWDARLTSELILGLLYIGIILVQQTFCRDESSEQALAVLVLVGLVDLPIIHYSVYWWNTLHQGSSFSLFAKPTIHASMLYPLLFCFLGFALFCAWCILHLARFEILRRERRQRWVFGVLEAQGSL
ncbi:MAG: heme ABC transporter permease CcmC [Legionellaceae bacterium]|nr:heme ABC transporter permease CcmC [Legionellaceae bacterium]